MQQRHGIGRQRDAFDKEWEKANRKMDRAFNWVFVLSVIFSVVIIAGVAVGIYIAYENWG